MDDAHTEPVEPDTPDTDADAPEDAPVTPGPAVPPLPARVSYEQAADMLCVSMRQLRALIRTGELPVIQPATGRRGALIEVAALHDYMDRLRVRAQRVATHRAKSCAACGDVS